MVLYPCFIVLSIISHIRRYVTREIIRDLSQETEEEKIKYSCHGPG